MAGRSHDSESGRPCQGKDLLPGWVRCFSIANIFINTLESGPPSFRQVSTLHLFGKVEVEAVGTFTKFSKSKNRYCTKEQNSAEVSDLMQGTGFGCSLQIQHRQANLDFPIIDETEQNNIWL